MSDYPLTLAKLRNNVDDTDFIKAYSRLMLRQIDKMSDNEKSLLLKVAVVFLNEDDYWVAKLGYRIIVTYCNIFKAYEPLYDVSINKGYIPITKFIEDQLLQERTGSENRFFNTLFSAYLDVFKQKNHYLSVGQTGLINFSRDVKANFVLVAPTSYGKSEIIVSKVKENLNLKICVLVPSKALLAQTKRRLIENEGLIQHAKRIITHPDMYKGNEDSFISVLTQERLLRLLQKHKEASIDLVLIDEAHNLLKGDGRAILLMQVLLILRRRNPKAVFNFFTPFISDPNNLKSPFLKYDMNSKNTDEYIKVERYFIFDIQAKEKLHLYDQFIDEFMEIEHSEITDEIEFVRRYKAAKNIIYANKPRDIEDIARNFSHQGSSLVVDAATNELIESISDFLHPEYYLLEAIRNKVVYHHGTMPDLIRLYVENAFANNGFLEFIVTSSTLLEGVNIPAEKLFLFNTKIGNRNFTKSEFKNLSGRICRFNELFNAQSGNLRMLEPEIYLIKGRYSAANANYRNFIRNTVKSDLTIKDDVENILLRQDKEDLSIEEIAKIQDSLEYLENIEPNTVQVDNITYVNSEIGRLCFKNNVYDFDIKASEQILVKHLDTVDRTIKINAVEPLLKTLVTIFIEGILIENFSLARLINEPAQKFYAMFLDWRMNGSSYKLMISKFLGYWKDISDPIVFVGSKWGEIKRNVTDRAASYIDISKKSDSERVNLAILRIKEEQDFIDNELMKYIEILNDLQLLDISFYEKIKYGTSDPKIICLLKNGFSIELAHCVLQNRYSDFVSIDIAKDEVHIKKGIIYVMQEAGENKILIFEINYHLS